MKPIYIKSFKRKIFKKGLTNYFILSNDKNYICNNEIRCIVHSYKYNLLIYIDKSIESHFNLYPEKWAKLGKLIPINQYLNLNGFNLIDFNSLIELISKINNTPSNYYIAEYHKDLISLLQLVIAKWDDWN